MKHLPLIIILTSLLYSCTSSSSESSETANTAQQVTNKAIAAMNGTILDDAKVSFDFRDRSYIYENRDGQYTYTRIHTDTAGKRTVDVLTNDTLIRSIDDEAQNIDAEWQQRYSNSVNSVMYFAFLPYRLNDPAVIKTYRGVVDIKGKQYHEILVQFKQEGGGVDHDDNFLYWFDHDTYAMDYFAYDYITDGGGVRFREAYNRRTVSGLVVQDYINYKPASKVTKLVELREAFESESLVELSQIELVSVELE